MMSTDLKNINGKNLPVIIQMYSNMHSANEVFEQTCLQEQILQR